MALGRALRKVLVIDSGLPCNRHSPRSHNFITHDGEKPAVIAEKARAQVLRYDSVEFLSGLAVSGKKNENGFTIVTRTGEEFSAKRLIFATGVRDILPDLAGFSACWGISIVHCPYCHGYELKNQKTGILANGQDAFHYAWLLRNWTGDLTLFTSGQSTLTREQAEKISKHKIPIIEKEIAFVEQTDGNVQRVVFKDSSTFSLTVLYARPPFEQHCKIPEELGCELTEQGLLKVDSLQKTSVDHIYACGDNTNPMRSVASAVAAGNFTGAAVNREMTEAEF